MITKSVKATNYFRASNDYFWRWADDGHVIEFANGGTICYHEELVYILKNLNIPNGVPLGAILLLLCACKQDYGKLYEFDTWLDMLGRRPEYDAATHAQAKGLVLKARAFLKIVNALPADLRSGLKRVSLLQAILQNQPDNGLPLNLLLQEFESGALDDVIFTSRFDFYFGTLYIDLQPLVLALAQFPNAAALELKLKTGLAAVPEETDILLPPALPGDLLTELEADLKTAGMARLAKKISAALNIPMHLAGSSDQSIGGVSDISNRGHYDKLLLSELAQDDLLLTARLANNEALFLQREEMPANNQQQWHLLIDTTLKMWGTPRVFASAAALAFSSNIKHGKTDALALGGNQADMIDIGTKQGIVTLLEKLDPGLNCGRQLQKVIEADPSPKAKFILITEGHYKEDAAFMANLARVKERLDYLVEVNRDGQIAFYETGGKKHKLINHALINLEETLFQRIIPQTKRYDTGGLPAMLSDPDYPLLFPASKIKINNISTFMFDNRVALLTQDRRLLYWTAKNLGAKELIATVTSGDCFWGRSDACLFLLINNIQAAAVTIYRINFHNYGVTEHALSNIKATAAQYDKGIFHLNTKEDVVLIDAESGAIIPGTVGLRQFQQLKPPTQFHVLNEIKKTINNGYSVINSVKSIFINPNGMLCIDKRELYADPSGRYLSLIVKEPNPSEWIKPLRQEAMQIKHLPKLTFTKFYWSDGSEAVLDSRGLLHLKSSDARIPEVTIILIVDKTTACWAADGKITGSPYFTGTTQQNVLLAANFYNYYIQAFIDTIKKTCS